MQRIVCTTRKFCEHAKDQLRCRLPQVRTLLIMDFGKRGIPNAFVDSQKAKIFAVEDEKMELSAARMQVPEGANLILGQSHFIKTAEDL